MRAALTVLLVTLLATVAFAQPCPDPNDVFWQRDTLPTNPTGLQTFSIIPGLCEGEAAAVVFELPVGMPPQQITQVVCPFGSAGGGQGALAYVNVEVYDGVSFSGAIANMGTQVFDLNTQTGNALQVTSSAFLYRPPRWPPLTAATCAARPPGPPAPAGPPPEARVASA